jgi:hypothetical protein
MYLQVLRVFAIGVVYFGGSEWLGFNATDVTNTNVFIIII